MAEAAVMPRARDENSGGTLGVILAGGLSSRMRGPEKTLLDLGGTPLIGHAIRRLRSQVDQLAINANGDPKRFVSFNLPVIPDLSSGNDGPLAGILAGLIWAKDRGFSEIVTAAGDTPFFPEDLVARLRLAARTHGTPISLAATMDPEKGLMRHPTFGLWPVGLADDLRQTLDSGTRKVVMWTDRHGSASAEFDPGPPDPFFNVNRPEDLAAAAAMLAE